MHDLEEVEKAIDEVMMQIRVVDIEIQDAVQRGVSSTKDRAYWRATEASLRKRAKSLRQEANWLQRKEKALRNREDELRKMEDVRKMLEDERRKQKDEGRREEYAYMIRQGLIGNGRLERFDFYREGP